ncbi:MAG TPA: site-2 protease family protein [Acidimicrobiales bacterium]|nr:site-2 protease family protein [Acidimicrobiales bacterium]
MNDPGGTADIVTVSPAGEGALHPERGALAPNSGAAGNGIRYDGEGTSGPVSEYREPKGSVVQLLAVVAVILALSMLTHSLDLLIVIVAVIAMIMIHELGHFATAKWSHMKVTEYFLGFGPRLWSFRRGETEYGVKAIPLGGYVKIIGMSNTEDVSPADETRTYRAQPFHNRIMVAVAGSFMHFVMAFVLLWSLFVFIGQPQPTPTVAGFSPVAHGLDPARSAGIRVGDVIVSIDGRPVTSVTQMEKTIGSHSGVPLALVVDRGSPARRVAVTVVPALAAGSEKNGARIGIEIGATMTPVSPVHALGTAAANLEQITTGTVAGLGHTFSPHGLSAFFNQLDNTKAADAAARTASRPVSIVGAVRLATQGAQSGANDLIRVLVIIIIAIGIINLVPMLPLDGGHVLVAVYERIRSRKGKPYRADVTKLIPVASAFVLFLIVFVVAAVFLDIAHPIANPFQ